MSFLQNALFGLRRNLPKLRPGQYREILRVPLAQTLLPQSVAQQLSETTLRLNLFYAWIFDQLPLVKRAGTIIDVGCKDFAYAPALARLAVKSFAPFSLTGLELDTRRVYVDLFRRSDHAAHYVALARQVAAAAGRVDYVEGDWLTFAPAQTWSLVCCFFPFLFADLHERFGLPSHSFAPRAFYEKLMRQGQELLLFHQGDEERRVSIELLQRIGGGEIVFDRSFTKNPWQARRHAVCVLLWRKV